MCNKCYVKIFNIDVLDEFITEDVQCDCICKMNIETEICNYCNHDITII